MYHESERQTRFFAGKPEKQTVISRLCAALPPLPPLERLSGAVQQRPGPGETARQRCIRRRAAPQAAVHIAAEQTQPPQAIYGNLGFSQDLESIKHSNFIITITLLFIFKF